MEWWHKAGILTGIATIASLMLAKKRRITKHIVCGPWESYEEAMTAHASLMGEYEAIAEEGNWELKEFTLPQLKVGPTGMKGGYAFTIKILGYPPSKYDAEDEWAPPPLPAWTTPNNQIFEWLQKHSVFYCGRCKASSEDEELHRVMTDNYQFIIYCEECYSKVFPQFDAEGYEVSFNTLPGALDFFPTSTGRPPDNYLDVEKEYSAEEEEEDTYAHALAEMKKYLMMTLGVTIPGIGAKQRDAARDFWEWFENKAETYHTTEVGDYECTYYTPEVKQCFYNAFMTLSEIEDAKYYEGWAVTLSGISIPIEHAWLVTKEGRVIDTTFALLEREYGHDKSEVVYMGVEIPYSYLLNAVVESGRAGPFLRNYWADDTDSGIEHEYRLYFAEGDPDYYPKHPRSHRSDPNLPWGRSPWDKQKDPYAPKPEEWDRDSKEGDPWRRNKKPEIKPTQYVRIINYPLFSPRQGLDLRKVEAEAKVKRKQIKDIYEGYHPQGGRVPPYGYGEKDIGDYFSK